MRILITGGAGFIGSNLSIALHRAGHRVTVLDSLSPQIHGADPRADSSLLKSIEDLVRFVQGSVTEESDWTKVLGGQDAIVHLAAETGTGQSMYEIKRYADVNVGGTALMLNLLASGAHEVRKVVVASSRALYGEGKYRSPAGVVYPGARQKEDLDQGRFEPMSATGEPLTSIATDEDSKLHPSSVYGITKLAQEQLVMTVCASLGIAATALRLQNVYGPGQSLANPYTGILSIFSKRIVAGKEINVFEDGRESRDFVYIDDVVRAITLALQSPQADGEVFGIGSGVGTNVLAAAQTLCAKFGRDVAIRVSGAYRLGDIRHNVADLAKARKVLGFEPSVAFDAGIASFVEWVLGQPLTDDHYERSLAELRAKGLMSG